MRYQIVLGKSRHRLIVGTTDAYLKRGIPLYYTSDAGISQLWHATSTRECGGVRCQLCFTFSTGAPPYKYIPIDLFLDFLVCVAPDGVVKR